MRSFGFLLSRRWLLFAIAVVLLGAAAWWLGQWQFDRLKERRADNAIVRANEGQSPAPLDELLSPAAAVDADDEWRLVTASGTYDTTDTVIVRYRSRDGVPGVDVVVPLVTASGTSLLVDRGFLETESAAETDDVPDPPASEVTVTGWVRVDATGDSTRVSRGSTDDGWTTRAISSPAIGAAQDRLVYGGFVDLRSEDPAPATSLEPVVLPELNDGPHFFYGLQWWFFGVLAVFGFGYLAYDERKRGPRGDRPRRATRPQRARSMPPSTGSIAPDTNDAAGDSRKAAALPNSAGSP